MEEITDLFILKVLRANKKKSVPGAAVSVGNGTSKELLEAIGMFDLVLPSGLVLKLNNCYYAPSIVRGVVSLSCLLDLGFHHTIASNGISVSLNGNLTSPYTPQQNGVSERRNRTLLDMVRSMFNLTTLPLSFWDYALESAVRILNMVPTKKVDKTPYEIWHGKAPNLSYLKVWGCEAYVKRDSADKLQQRSVKCIFVGYPKETMGYYFYFPPENKKMIIWIHGFSIGINSWLTERTKRAPNRLCLNMEVEDDEVGDLGEPANYKTAMLDPDKEKLHTFWEFRYIEILKKFSMQNSKKGFIPMEVKHDLSNEMCASSDEEKAYMKKVPYASAVGSIMYVVRCTRPDVAFAQNLVSRYQQNPGKLHWVAVKHILKYLRNTKDMFLVYGGNPDTELDVTGFCDASWQCDKDDTKSQTGYVFIVNGGAVDWKSKKQTTIAMHATQSEYMAASEAAMEAVWIRKFVGDLGVMPSINKPINMYCDNSAAIIFANEPGVMKGARHFLRRYHYVREQVESGEIKLIKVHTDKNLADAFTKALPRGKVNEHANGIGLRLASSFMHICD
ncbi:retrotransposon protein, putative, ty1-copia subclass [Tanacetum coccineum]